MCYPKGVPNELPFLNYLCFDKNMYDLLEVQDEREPTQYSFSP